MIGYIVAFALGLVTGVVLGIVVGYPVWALFQFIGGNPKGGGNG